MLDMPRPRPPYLHRQITQHDRVVWYVRRGKGGRKRIKAEPGTPEFQAEYQAALENAPMARAFPENGTLAWLIARYRDSSAWSALSKATQKQRENIFLHVVKTGGAVAYAKVTAEHIEEGRERRADTPAQSRNFLDAMRGLFRWAKQAKFVKTDPTAGVINPKRPKTGGFKVWSEEDVEKYYRRWPIGTRQRVWIDVLLYTGLRRGDAVRLGRQHVRDGIASIKTEKSNFQTTVHLPILPILSTTLQAGPCGEMAFICGALGKPLDKVSFGNEFRGACNAAGVPGSAHGLRKLAATRAANRGATVAELEALFGWNGGGMASLYTRSADRRRLSMRAIRFMDEPETSIPSPENKVRGSEEK